MPQLDDLRGDRVGLLLEFLGVFDERLIAR
jgi:hypothetical protein